MSKDSLEVLKNKHPNLLKEIRWLECGDGWLPIIESLCKLIEAEINRMPEETRSGIGAVQIKEKFGGLRFYMSEETPFISGAIAMAESMSYKTCEVCGSPGQVRNLSWIRCLCETHFEESKKKK